MQFYELPENIKNVVNKAIKNQIKSPEILFSKKQLIYNFGYLKEKLKFEAEDIYFSVKSNNEEPIIETLNSLNSGFEIGSKGELELMKKHKILPERIIYSNPVKLPEHIAQAANYGVKTFAFDCESELLKIAKNAAGSKVYGRLKVNNEGATWDLINKFGTTEEQIIKLFHKAKELNLTPCGITLHLGWNNNNLAIWEKTMEEVNRFIKKCEKSGFELSFIDLGGGFPSHKINQFKTLDEIEIKISSFLKKTREKGIRIISEPGSFLVTNTACLFSRIFDIIERENKTWVFIDSGINQGFYWIYTGLEYPVIYPQSTENKEMRSCVITGPSCDTHDIFTNELLLPEDIKIGEPLIVFPAGAYINSAKYYNGFSYPPLKNAD